MAETARRPGRGTIAVTVFAFLILVALGTWQVERLQWKESLLAEIESRRHASPISIQTMTGPAAENEYRHMAVTGRFDHAHEQYFFATDDGAVGYHVYTPLLLADGHVLFVNRGFVPEDFKDPAKRAAGQVAGDVAVTGLVRAPLPGKPSWLVPDNEPAKRLYFWKDLHEMARQSGVDSARLEPFFLDADSAPNPGGWPKGGATQIDLPNNHLSYAVTWYGLAVVLVAVSVLAFRRKAR